MSTSIARRTKRASADTFGAKIRRRRRELEMPQYELAEKVGWYASSVNQLEGSSRGTPELPRALALVEALDIPDPIPMLKDVLLDRGQAVYPVDESTSADALAFLAELGLALHKGLPDATLQKLRTALHAS